MNFKRSKIWACSRLLATSFLGLFCAGGFLNLNMTMMVAHAEGHVFDGNCINRTTYDPETGILTIPSGYTEIKNLGNRKGIKTVNIPASITKIGSAAFRDCSSLTNVNNIEPNSKLKTIDDHAFNKCTALKTINLPEGLEEIGFQAFSECTSLTNIRIPSTVNNIATFAFAGCTSLREIFLPEKIEAIGIGAFSYCGSLENINIPDGVKEIGDAAFSGCTSLKTIALPKGLRRIGVDTFNNCNSLKEISLPENISVIAAGAFEKCSSLENINIPDDVKRIGPKAFSDCTSLKTIALPTGLQEIGLSAFCNCSSITSIDMPDTVLEMDGGVFSGCTSLKDVHLSENLQKIPFGTFWYCSSLENINVPNKVQKIGTGVFSGCNLLKEVHLPHSLEEVAYDAFEDCNSLGLIEIPYNTKIVNWITGKPSDLVIGRDTKIVRFACDSEHKCDSSPNVSEGEEPRPRSFGGEPFLGRAFLGMGAHAAPLSGEQMLEVYRDQLWEDTVREYQSSRSTGKHSFLKMALVQTAAAAVAMATPHLTLDPNIWYNHGSEATDPYAFLDRYHFVLQKDLLGLPLVKVIDKGEFHSKTY